MAGDASRGESGGARGARGAGHGDRAVDRAVADLHLRNQLVHGGATWGASVNREQMRDCTNFMAKLVPLVIEVMMDHPKPCGATHATRSSSDWRRSSAGKLWG